MSYQSTQEQYVTLASKNGGKKKRHAVIFNVAAGLAALVTGGIIVPTHQIVSGATRRLLGVRGIASDAAHFDLDCKVALLQATKEQISRDIHKKG